MTREPDRPAAPPPRLRDRVPLLLDALARLYPEAAITLDHAGPLQLVVATVLSAQCTDRRVNLVTPALFARFKTAQDFAAADLREIERYVKSTGFFRTKAKNIRALCRVLVERHGGEVPGTLAELVALPGVGRKTANVVLGDGFGVPGVTVDTHVGRLSRRLGLTLHADPVKVERDLMRHVPQAEWTRFSHRLILHGRQVCHARKPLCGSCALADLCPRRGVVKSSSRQVVKSRGRDGGSGSRTTSSRPRSRPDDLRT